MDTFDKRRDILRYTTTYGMEIIYYLWSELQKSVPEYLFSSLSSNVILKLFYSLSIDATLQRIRNIVPLRYINWLID